MLSFQDRGLGTRRFMVFNQALLGKWLWCFGLETDFRWCRGIPTKYGLSQDGWCTAPVGGTYGVNLWKHIRDEPRLQIW